MLAYINDKTNTQIVITVKGTANAEQMIVVNTPFTGRPCYMQGGINIADLYDPIDMFIISDSELGELAFNKYST